MRNNVMELTSAIVSTFGAGVSIAAISLWATNENLPAAVSIALAVSLSVLPLILSIMLHTRSAQKALAVEHKEIVARSSRFFNDAGQKVFQRSYRDVEIRSNNMGRVERGFARSASDKFVPVEEVQDMFHAIQKLRSESTDVIGYLAYAHELDPAAARQLDVYRIRDKVVIIPLPLQFMEAKSNEGQAAARVALDGLRRRYLGFQDLFDIRNAIDEPRFFFGRRELLADLFNALTRGEHVALLGPRKSGKTSALNLLQQRLASYPVIKIDFQIFQRGEDWPGELFDEVLERYDHWGQLRHGSKWKPQPVSSPLSGRAFRQALLERRDLQEASSGPLPLILLFDEIERVFPRLEGTGKSASEHIERFIHAAGILRSLGQEGGERLISIIVADLSPAFNRTNRFTRDSDTNPFYRFFQECFLPPLNAEECDEMLKDISHAMGLEVEEDVRRKIFSDSGGHAALARQLASAACRQRDQATTITSGHYKAGLKWLFTENGQVTNDFKRNLWNESSPAEKRVLVLSSKEKPVRQKTLENPGPVPRMATRIPDRAPVPTRNDLSEARRALLATGMLESIDERYRVRGALLRGWFRENTTLDRPAAPRPAASSESGTTSSRPTSTPGQGSPHASYRIHAKSRHE